MTATFVPFPRVMDTAVRDRSLLALRRELRGLAHYARADSASPLPSNDSHFVQQSRGRQLLGRVEA